MLLIWRQKGVRDTNVALLTVLKAIMYFPRIVQPSFEYSGNRELQSSFKKRQTGASFAPNEL